MSWSRRRRWSISGLLFLAVAAGLGWMFFEQTHVQRADPVTSAGQSPGARDVESTGTEAPALMPERRPVGPNVVTRVDGTAVWNLPEDQREPFLASLRSLADAGWSEAFLALAPVASRCILTPPRKDSLIASLYDPDDGAAYRHLRVEEESPLDRAAMRGVRLARLERELREARHKRERCDSALGDDPDVYMTWLEQALIQQPPGFFAAMLDNPPMVPNETGWLVRNAERLARFNLGFLNALRARVMAGDPEVVDRAWRAFAGRQFMPEPEPHQARTYAMLARMLPSGLSGDAPSDESLEQVLGGAADSRDAARAREAARELYRQCCSSITGR